MVKKVFQYHRGFVVPYHQGFLYDWIPWENFARRYHQGFIFVLCQWENLVHQYHPGLLAKNQKPSVLKAAY